MATEVKIEKTIERINTHLDNTDSTKIKAGEVMQLCQAVLNLAHAKVMLQKPPTGS